MPQGFGARLRKQREDRHIDLSWIAEQTKIKRSLLESLERDDVSRWPSGIFRRAYIRTYAQMIGLDPDVVVREFLQVHPEPVDVLEAAAAAAIEESARKNGAPAIRLRTIVDSALGSLARLRRPGAIDGPLPPAPPLNPPAPAVVELPAAAPPNAAAAGEDAAPPVPDHVAPPSPDREAAAPVNEPVAEVDAFDVAVPQPDLPAVDDGGEQARTSNHTDDVGTETASDPTGASMELRLEEVAKLCTEFGCAGGRDEILLLLEDSARALDATGLIVWLWDESSGVLRPALVHGYSDQVRALLPTVRPDADNATAAAFRSASTCEVTASAQATGALVLPLLIPEGCAGVLAVELQPGLQPLGSLRGLATVLAAAVAQLVHRSRPATQRSLVLEPADGTLAPDRVVRQTDETTPPARRKDPRPGGAMGHNG